MLSDPRPRVLYVDDHEDSREMLSTLLRSSRIETTTVATGAQALLLIEAERFDLYVLDLWLPDIDGLELCRRMRASDPYTPILFFSGAGYDTDKKRGIEAGASAYLTKPDVDGLLSRIMQFVSHPRRATAAPVLVRGTIKDIWLSNNKHKREECQGTITALS